MSTDAHIQAFLKNPLDVFQLVEHRHEIWRRDPFDVDSIHAHSRGEFRRLLSIATTPPGQERGRILLLRGNGGTGKTHLLRAFRNEVHSTRAGLVGYMLIPAQPANYARYILSNLIDSLDQPYDEEVDRRSGLVWLAGILASRAFQPQLAQFLRDEADLSPEEVSELVLSGAESLLQKDAERYGPAGLHLLQALLLLHRPDPRIKNRVLMYLRCEDLTEADQRVIGGLKPKTRDGDPQEMIKRIGRLIWAVGNMALVFCLDQLESVQTLSDAAGMRTVIQTICDLAEEVPSSIFVVCCLDDIWDNIRSSLIQTYLVRIEVDPEPCVLKEDLSPAQAADLIGARMRQLYSSAELPVPSDPLFPFDARFLGGDPGGLTVHRTTRDLLHLARRYREACRAAETLVDVRSFMQGNPPESSGNKKLHAVHLAFEQKWSDTLAESRVVPPDADDEAGIATLIAWALETAGTELESGWRFEAKAEGAWVTFESKRSGRTYERTWVAVCNRTPRFGWLAKQIDGCADEAEKDPDRPRLVLLRSSEFSKAVDKSVTRVIRQGGAKVVVPHGDWRAMLTFRKFQAEHGKAPHFDSWAMEENHLSQLPSIRAILDLDRLERIAPDPATATALAAGEKGSSGTRPHAAPTSPDVAPEPFPRTAPVEPSVSAPRGNEPLALGATRGVAPQAVTMSLSDLTRHAAFLGGSGSGKTTLALSVLEQALLRGVPCILLDRKGDLAGYARKAFRAAPLADPVLEARRQALIASVDVALFTPGHPHGRPLSIALAPMGLADMEEVEREEAAACAASALSDMLGYRTSSKDKALRAILLQAFLVLGSYQTDRKIDLQAIIDLVSDQDPALISAIGKLDTKLFKQIEQDAEALKFTTTQLFSAVGEPLDVDLLLGSGSHATPGKTRLSIISTKFLRDESQALFWVAQLLLAISRWSAKNPKDRLQALAMFDEADLYLPAMRQPATKAPMENLLKRSRSAGLGIMLATQSPGDLDYRCRDNVRTWFLGRIKEPTALAKLKPMTESAPGDLLSKLPDQATGEFCLIGEKRGLSFMAARSALDTEQIPDEELLILARATLSEGK